MKTVFFLFILLIHVDLCFSHCIVCLQQGHFSWLVTCLKIAWNLHKQILLNFSFVATYFMLSIQAIMHHFSSWFWSMKLLILVGSSTLLLNTLKSCGLMFFPSDWFCELREVALFFTFVIKSIHIETFVCAYICLIYLSD